MPRLLRAKHLCLRFERMFGCARAGGIDQNHAFVARAVGAVGRTGEFAAQAACWKAPLPYTANALMIPNTEATV